MQITLDWDKWHQSLVHQSFVLLCRRILTGRRNILILTHEPLIIFSLPCPLSKGVTEQFGMGTWCLAKANPPLCPVLGSLVWERHGHTGESPSKYHEDAEDTGVSFLPWLRERGLFNPKREGSRRSHQGIEMYEGRVQRGWSQVQTYSTSLSVIWATGSSATKTVHTWH